MPPRMKSLALRPLALAALALSTAAAAHDLWLQPASYRPASGVVPLSVFVGHGSARENWGVRSDRILLLRNVAPNGGVVDLRRLIRPGTAAPTLSFRLSVPGTHQLAMQSNHAESNLPAVRFNDYAKEEGLTPALRARAAAGREGTPGREIYSRRAKALVQIGPYDPRTGTAVLRPLGLSLEIVPLRNPYAPRPDGRLPLRVLWKGRPLAGALVKLTNLDADERPVATRRSDRVGLAMFAVPQRGKWLVNVVWTESLSGNPRAEFDTTFSSLTFGYPG